MAITGLELVTKKKKKKKGLEKININGEKKEKRQKVVESLPDRWKLMEKKWKARKNGTVCQEKSSKIKKCAVVVGRVERKYDQENMFPTKFENVNCDDQDGRRSTGTIPKRRNLDDDHQSVKNALRAAMETTRFAEIFPKAKRDIKEDVKKESERVVKKDHEAAESREKQREAARIALKMVERSVEFEDNLMIHKELEMLTQCSLTYSFHRCNGPLEQLGLFIKEEFEDDDDEEMLSGWDIEEGEIVEY